MADRQAARSRLSYYGLVTATLPCLGAAVVVAVVENLLGDDGRAALFVAGPFLRAVERDGRRSRGGR